MTDYKCGDKIGTVNQTLGRIRRKDSEQKTSQYVNLNSLDVENGGQYVFKLHSGSQGLDFEGPVTFSRTVQSAQKAITIPKEILSDCGLLPGDSIAVTVFEYVPDTDQQTITNSDEQTPSVSDNSGWEVIGTASVSQDQSAKNNAGSSLNSKGVKRQTESEPTLKFTNNRTGKSAVGETYFYDSRKTRFYFPSDVREAIDARGKDLIKISKPVKKEVDEYGDQLNKIESELAELNDAFDNLAEVTLQVKEIVNND